METLGRASVGHTHSPLLGFTCICWAGGGGGGARWILLQNSFRGSSGPTLGQVVRVFILP